MLDYRDMKVHTYKFFPQPIFSFEIDNYKTLNLELEKFILEEFNKDNEGLKRSNVNGWHSKPFKFEKGNAAHNFAMKIESCIFDVFNSVRSSWFLFQ